MYNSCVQVSIGWSICPTLSEKYQFYVLVEILYWLYAVRLADERVGYW
jgi:hypothetical protein